MSGAASGSGPSDEERAVDVLALPTPDPLNIDFSFPSITWNALPSWGPIRQTRPDRQQEVVEDLQRQLAEARNRERRMESAMAEHARAFGLHERSQAEARIETVRREANIAVARAEEAARHQEALAQKAAFELQARTDHASEL